MYDHHLLHEAFLKRLRGRTLFSLTVLVDAGKYVAGGPHRQKGRLQALVAAGAAVYLCHGKRTTTNFHLKALVVDRRYCFCGSLNFTDASESSEELCLKLAGPQVAKVLGKLAAKRAKSKSLGVA